MFVNKISNNGIYHQKPNFKGYDHEINSVGTPLERFNYPFDYEKERCEIEIFDVKEDPTAYAGYRVIEDKPIFRKDIKKGGTRINLSKEAKIPEGKAFAYRFVINGEKAFADTGTHLDSKYTLVTQKGTRPMNKGGSGILITPDIYLPGAYYAPFESDTPGKIIYDENRQKEAEKTKRTYDNIIGGSLAGIHYDLKNLRDDHVKVIYLTPFGSVDTTTYHGYSSENNNQINYRMGNTETFDALTTDMFKYGMRMVYDATFTSEGLAGIHVQYNRRWGDKDPFAQHLFTLDKNVTFGIVPTNLVGYTHEIINSPVTYKQNSNGLIEIEENKDYDPNKETYFRPYSKLDTTDKLSNNSYQDAGLPYKLQIVDPQEYVVRLKALNEYNKHAKKPIMVDSAEGAIFLATFGTWNISPESAGILLWDANVDLVKRNHCISGSDEDKLQSEPSISRRNFAREKRRVGGYMNTDMDIQTIRYWAGRVKDNQILYTAQTLKGAKTADEINTLIEAGKLPKEAQLDTETVENIVSEWYQKSVNRMLDKEDVTLRAIMKLPLTSLEVDSSTVQVLSTPFFSNRAVDDKTIGKTRFELMKEGNPQLDDTYARTYLKVQSLYTNELLNFTHEVLRQVNNASSEKLFDDKGNYTEYGESVVNIIGKDIVKYALLKAIGGKNFKTKIDEETGVIHYNYAKLRDNTSLKSLGINDQTPEEEALHLQRIIKRGLDDLTKEDAKFLAESIGTKIKDTTAQDFRMAEVIVKHASQGLDCRLDAVKDNVDMDAVRTEFDTFDDALESLVKYCSYIVKALKDENPSAVITAEITDMGDMLKKTFGEEILGYSVGQVFDTLQKMGARNKSESDAILHLLQESGITTEAAYSYFFTSVIRALSQDFENGNDTGSILDIMKAFKTLITTRNLDYIKNLYTFIGNHDKARVAHFFALNMGQFYASFSPFDGSKADFERNKWAREQALMRLAGVDAVADMPLEFRLNVNNPEYFMTVSPRAIAMSTLLNDAINQNLQGDSLINETERKYLKQALADLADGKYLGNGDNISRTVIQIKELKTFKNAFDKIIELAKSHGLNLSEEEINSLKAKVLEEAKKDSLVYKHLVQGDFDWGGENKQIGINNQKRALYVLTGSDGNSETDYMPYSMYTVSIAAILKEALQMTNPSEETSKAFADAIKDFVHTYTREVVENGSSKFPYVESGRNAMRKNGFAESEIDLCAEMLLEQAKYIAEQNGDKNLFQKAEEIAALIYAGAVEPGIQKLGIAISILEALPGLATLFAGDKEGSTGGCEKTKNIYNQQRNVRKVSEFLEGAKQNVRNRIKNFIEYSMDIRKREGLVALREGTPYLVATSNGNVPAILYQDAKGNMAISIINITGYEHGNRVDYFEKLKIKQDPNAQKEIFKEDSSDKIVSVNPDNPMVPIQRALELDYIELPPELSLPIGTIFTNSVPGYEDETYRVTWYDVKEWKKEGDKMVEKFAKTIRAIIREENDAGKKIVIDGKNARNGIMVLQHLVEKPAVKKAAQVAFHGRSKYTLSNPIYNTYKTQELPKEGQKLSIVSR